ncbi:MAG TPA: hypothetical protein VF426_03840 [Marmoricola sp.]
MAKIICAIHGEAPPEQLTQPELRRALAAAGASTLQVNLDDADVAAAMRFGPGERIVAVVSVWTDGDPGAVADVVAGAVGGAAVDAYLVTERVRLDPASVPDGARSDVLAQVALLRRPAEMSREDYLAYWMLEHTAIAIRTQATSAYVQNIVDKVITPGSPDIAGIVEEHFSMAAMADQHAFYGSGGDQAELDRRFAELMASVARFGADRDLDLVPTSRYSWSL